MPEATEYDPLIAYQDDGSDALHQPYLAACQGFDAYEQDLPRSLNPYLPESREESWWDDGWATAEEQADAGDGESLLFPPE